MKKYTVEDLDREFASDGACLEWIKERRWPNGIYCTRCQKVAKHHPLKNRNCYCCDYCGTQVYPSAGTIFRKSTTSLRTWFYAIYRMASTHCGVSAKQVQRETGLTYKTAWRMCKLIKRTLAEDIQLFHAEEKAGECGGEKGRKGTQKAVAGVLSRSQFHQLLEKVVLTEKRQ